MRKIITFLGMNYQDPVSYTYNGKVYTGKVFPEALRQFTDYDQMLVFVTKGAKEKTWKVLEDLNDPRIIPVDIENGENTEEMWSIFDVVTSHVEEGETVIFDITHGLRSIPFLAFLFAAYLKTAKSVRIVAIYYGALELRKNHPEGHTPVFDLSGFVSMLDWITATDQFIQTGDARRLAKQINPHDLVNGSLAKASDLLVSISQAAFLCQPFALMDRAAQLESRINKAQEELHATARPFGLLKDQIVNAYSRFGVKDARNLENVKEVLQSEFRLVKWYHQNNQLMLAATLAREWFIDAITYRLELPIDYKRSTRGPIEIAITGVNKWVQAGCPDPENFDLSKPESQKEDEHQKAREIFLELCQWQEKEKIARIIDMISQVRNTLDHAEHQNGSMGIVTMTDNLRELVPQLEEFAMHLGLY